LAWNTEYCSLCFGLYQMMLCKIKQVGLIGSIRNAEKLANLYKLRVGVPQFNQYFSLQFPI